MSSGKKMDLIHAQTLAAMLVTALEPACERFAVAGSVRRKKAQVGDIELVCIPVIDSRSVVQHDMFGEVTGQKTTITNHLDNKLAEMLKETAGRRRIFRSVADMVEAGAQIGVSIPWEGEDVKRWGERYKRFYLHYSLKKGDLFGPVAVDLFCTTWDAWGAIMTIRTGPSDFSKALVNHIRYKTNFVQEDGFLRRKASKQIVPVRSESDYFRVIGVPFIAPEERTVEALHKAVRAAKPAPAGV